MRGVQKRVSEPGSQLRRTDARDRRGQEGVADTKTEHRWGVMNHCFILLNFSSCKFFKTNMSIFYSSQNI